MLKLNSVDKKKFSDIEFYDRKVSVNGKELSRNSIVATGRMVACEYMGKNLQGYKSLFDNSSVDYATLSKDHKEQKFLFCAALAEQAVGREAPKTFEEAKANHSFYAHNSTFLTAWNAIDVDVISPLYAAVLDDVGANGLMETVTVPFGQTYQLDIQSNDIFVFEDVAWGSARSTTYNYLYGKTVTLTPSPVASAVKIKWYQDVVQGEAGRYYAALIGGMWNKIYAKLIDITVNSIGNTTYVPSRLTANTYTTGNFLNISTLVATLNNVTRSDLIALGTPQVLNALLPVDGTGGAIAGLQYGLGEEWFGEGYLGRVGKVSTMEVNPIVVPGTQNSTIDTISLGDNLIILARGGVGYKPVYLAIGEGSPMDITMTPTETADLTIDINLTAYFDMRPVFASKVGVIQNVA